MAFLREYSEQGDPWTFRTMRAGKLKARGRSRLSGKLLRRGGRGRASPRSLAEMIELNRQLFGYSGDPFRFRMPRFLKPPKALRKLTFKKVGSAIGRVAKAALPIALPFLPGGTFLAPLLGGLMGGRGEAPGGYVSTDSPAPELVMAPPRTGTVGEAMRRPAPSYADYLDPGDDEEFLDDDEAYLEPDDDDDDDEGYMSEEDE